MRWLHALGFLSLLVMVGCDGTDGSSIDRPDDQAFNGGDRDQKVALEHTFVSLTVLGDTDEPATVTAPGSTDTDPAAMQFSLEFAFDGTVLPVDPGFGGANATGTIEITLTDQYDSSQNLYLDVEVNP